MTKIEEQTQNDAKSLKPEIWKKLPILIIEKILYQVFALKNNQEQTFELDYYDECKKRSCISFTNSSKQLSFECFNFLTIIDRDYINLTKFEKINDNPSPFVYENSKFNFDKKRLREIMCEFILPNDLEKSLIAGGFFSKYIANNAISVKFANLFKVLSKKSDIDIYISSSENNHNNYELYKSHLQSRKFKIYDDLNGNDNQYKFNCFKINTKNGEILNFVFVNDEYQSRERSNFDLINEFDLDLSKIFYSYHFDSVYVHVSFFKQFRLICNFFSECFSEINDLRKYEAILSEKKTYVQR